jgi:hypothetical protein
MLIRSMIRVASPLPLPLSLRMSHATSGTANPKRADALKIDSPLMKRALVYSIFP